MARPRYLLKLKSLDFVSPVDVPAQETAKVLLFKRDSGEFEATAEVAKVSDDLGLVFCWAFTSTVKGEAYHDLQGDAIDEDFVKAAAEFMQNGGAVDEMHDGKPGLGAVIFAMPMTAEIAKAFGVKTDTTGLMIALKPPPDVLQKFKDKTYTGVSIAGTGERQVIKATSSPKCAKCSAYMKADDAKCASCGTAIAKTIREEDGKYVLYTADGEKKLSEHDTKAEAEAQERAIQANKGVNKGDFDESKHPRDHGKFSSGGGGGGGGRDAAEAADKHAFGLTDAAPGKNRGTGNRAADRDAHAAAARAHHEAAAAWASAGLRHEGAINENNAQAHENQAAQHAVTAAHEGMRGRGNQETARAASQRALSSPSAESHAVAAAHHYAAAKEKKEQFGHDEHNAAASYHQQEAGRILGGGDPRSPDRRPPPGATKAPEAGSEAKPAPTGDQAAARHAAAQAAWASAAAKPPMRGPADGGEWRPQPRKPRTKKRFTKQAVLTSTADGHQHQIDLDDPADQWFGDKLRTTEAVADGSEQPHGHDWIFDAATGAITIAESAGHSHTVDSVVPADVLREAQLNEDGERCRKCGQMCDSRFCPSCGASLSDTSNGVPTAAVPDDDAESGPTIIAISLRAPDSNSPPSEASPSVDNEDKEHAPMATDALQILTKRHEDLEKRNVFLEKFIQLTDAEKAHHDKLVGQDKDVFLNKSALERQVEISELAKADEIVYTSPVTGEVFRKSCSPRELKLQKQADEATIALRVESQKRADGELARKGSELLNAFSKGAKGNLQMRLMKAINTEFTDPTDYEEVVEALKGMNAAMVEASKPKGYTPQIDTSAVADPKAQLETLAKRYADENKVDFSKAYTHVLNTPQGAALYAAADRVARA